VSSENSSGPSPAYTKKQFMSVSKFLLENFALVGPVRGLALVVGPNHER